MNCAGNQRYIEGTLDTDKGYIGQFHDGVTGLDYYNARYYDPVVGQFLSPDSVQGNAQGMDPYSYVAENPETRTDPTGQLITCGTGGSCGGSEPASGTHPNPGSAVDLGNCQENGNCGRSSGTGGSGCPGGCNAEAGPKTPKSSLQGPCNSQCQLDISKVRNHDYAQEQKALSWVSFAADIATLIGLGIATVIDWGDWAQFFTDLAEFIAMAVVTGADLASALGANVTGLFGTIVSVAKAVVAGLDVVRGVLDFVGAIIDPLKGWLKKAVDFFAVQAAKRVNEGLALLFPEIADAGFYGGSGIVEQYWTNQLAADNNLFPSAAYQECVADYSVSACK